MNYPLISEYIESIKSAEDNFNELDYLRPVLGDEGLPVMTSGNFAVVFKMKDEQSGKFYALKCFTKEQEGRAEAYREIAKELKDVSSPYLVSIRYLDKELFVDTDQTTETEFPVLLMDWVEGKTLDKYLRENLDDKYAIELLAYRFIQLAQWLIPQPFAHGDLKPDNILVREDGTLVLVDYDGMYVPAMKGQKARELGSPDFRHPLRTEEDFDEHIDDFPIVSMVLSIKALYYDPQLLNEYGAYDRLLFSDKDYINFESSEVFAILKEYSELREKIDLLRNMCKNKNYNIGKEFCEREVIREIQKYHFNKLRSDVDWGSGSLVGCCKTARFVNGVEIIDERRLANVDSLRRIELPKTIRRINKLAFSGCNYLQLINIQETRTTRIDDKVFSGCKHLGYISLPPSLQSIGDYAFERSGLVVITIPQNVKNIGDYAFEGCMELRQVRFTSVVNHLGKRLFSDCPKLKHIIIPKGTRLIYENMIMDFKDKLIEIDSLKYSLSKALNLVLNESEYAAKYYEETSLYINLPIYG